MMNVPADAFRGCTIPINGGKYQYRLYKADDLNWQVQLVDVVPALSKKTGEPNKHAGSERIEVISYHPTLGKACKWLCRNLADEVDFDTLDEYARRLERIGREIEQECEQYVKRKAVAA